MAASDDDIIFNEICVCKLEELASPRWLKHHQAIVRLSLRAVAETAQLKEERVYAQFMSTDKVTLLVHDAILIEIWREQILPHLLKQTETSKLLSPMMVYTVLYHEGCIVTLLELIVYHSAGCESLGDSIVDLIDYCHRTLAKVGVSSDYVRDAQLEHLDLSQLEASVAIRCIGIMRYIAAHSDCLSEIVTTRMLTTTDVPLLVVQLMEQRPWIHRKTGQIYDNGQWRTCRPEDDDNNHPVAAHLWLLLLSLLFHPAAPRKYDLNDHRCQQLLKLRAGLNQVLLDQIPPLADLERWLVQLSVTGTVQELWNNSSKKAFILELVAGLREHLLQSIHLEEVIESQMKCLSNESPEIYQKLAVIYDPEELESTLNCTTSNSTASTSAESSAARRQPTCVVCGVEADNRCSRCRSKHYCSKECQVLDWPQHKAHCKPNERLLAQRQPHGGLLKLPGDYVTGSEWSSIL